MSRCTGSNIVANKDAQFKWTIQGQLSVGYSMRADRSIPSVTGHQYASTDTVQGALVVMVVFSPLVPMQRQNECHTWWFEKIQSVSASEGVTRSRHSSAWPIPFYGQLLTSQSGTVAGPREESSLRGTEAICLCSGPVGRSHTATGKRIARGSADRGRKGEREGRQGWEG